MKPKKVLVSSPLVAFLILVQLQAASAGPGHHHHATTPQDSQTPSADTSPAATNSTATMFPPITSYFKGMPAPAQPAATAPVAAIPVDPVAEAARKEATAARVLAWHHEQADAGSAYGQYQMGMHYLKGTGVAKDLQIAQDWFLKSAKQGNDDAYEMLKNVDFSETVHTHQDFMVQSGHPKGRPGYVIDYLTPLTTGGADVPANLQWVPIEDARKAEKWDEFQPLASSAAHVTDSAPAPAQAQSEISAAVPAK